jgi:hypothetical protein
VIDAVGVVRYTQVGFEAGDEKVYRDWIERLLEESRDADP